MVPSVSKTFDNTVLEFGHDFIENTLETLRNFSDKYNALFVNISDQNKERSQRNLLLRPKITQALK